jgi:hypothetical protein
MLVSTPGNLVPSLSIIGLGDVSVHLNLFEQDNHRCALFSASQGQNRMGPTVFSIVFGPNEF